MSLSNPNTVVTEQRLKDFYDRILPYLGGSADVGFTPIGTVIPMIAETAPANYLICDGATYNKSDYPELSAHLLSMTNHSQYEVSGDSTKFKVPDLRGEFIRMTGTNSHANQGSGANVGTHQDATTSPYFIYYNADNKIYMSGKSVGSQPVNTDSLIGNSSNTGRALYNSSSTDTYVDPDNRVSYTTRPTNTSVLFCIATKNIYLNPSLDYSTDEKVVGTWIDGKPIYQKTVSFALTNASTKAYAHGISNFGFLVKLSGTTINNNSGGMAPFPNTLDGYNDAYKQQTTLSVDATNIYARNTGVDRSMITAYVTIQYTKTSD